MSAAVWSRGGSISRLLGSAFPTLDAGLGLGVASEDSPGTKFYCFFYDYLFPAESLWLHVVSGTLSDSRGQQMLVAAEQPAVAGHFLPQLPPGNAIRLEAQLLGVPGIPVPQNLVLGVVFP